MNCGFFCDTGAIIGICDINDKHHDSCQFFFKKYPINSNNYYIPETVKEELKHRKEKIGTDALKNHPQKLMLHSYIRAVQRCMDKYIKNMKTFNCNEHGNDSLEKLNKIIPNIQQIIGYTTPNQVNDTAIVANAVVWSTLKEYDFKTLITVDKKDLCSKEGRIINECKKHLNEDVDLTMLYLPSYYTTNIH